jgi:putative addiction module component (TIGR02574 family)
MPNDQTFSNVVASTLALPADERLAVMDAIHVSLADPSIDHGPAEPANEVAAAWKEELARRIADIESGRVKTIPAREAEGMIRGDGEPTVRISPGRGQRGP